MSAEPQESNIQEDLKKHARPYIVIFVALTALTIANVAVFYLQLPIHLSILIAVGISTIQAALVACYSMHLMSERKVIYTILILTVVFIVGLPFLTMLAFHDVPKVPKTELAK